MAKKVIVTCNADNNAVVWKSDIEDFGTDTEVVVPFSREGIFIKDGMALDTLDEGKHILNEKKGLFNKEKGTKCKLYFINKSLNMKINWGTPSPINLIDSMLNVPVRVGAHGEFEIKVENSRKFLLKMVGNTDCVTTEYLKEFFRGKLMFYIKDALAEAMIEQKISFYEIDTNLKEISKKVEDEIKHIFDEYGVSLVSFMILGVSIPEEIKKEIERELLEKKKLEIKGTSFAEERKIAHEQKLEIISAENAIKMADKKGVFCIECGAELPRGSKFCNVCGVMAGKTSLTCAECGYSNDSEAKFCSKCGKRLG